MLYEKTEGRNHLVSPELVATNFRPAVGVERVRFALDSLVSKGYAKKDDDEYTINRAGIDWVEAEHAIGFDGQNYQYRRRRAGQPLVTKGRSIDWTKWGRIIAALGVLATILIAVLS